MGKMFKRLTQKPSIYIWMMFVFSVATFFISPNLSYVELGVCVLFLIPYFINKTTEDNKLSEYLSG